MCNYFVHVKDDFNSTCLNSIYKFKLRIFIYISNLISRKIFLPKKFLLRINSTIFGGIIYSSIWNLSNCTDRRMVCMLFVHRGRYSYYTGLSTGHCFHPLYFYSVLLVVQCLIYKQYGILDVTYRVKSFVELAFICVCGFGK